MVSVLLVIAGMGLAFIALVGGNGGPRWSGLVSIPSHIASRKDCAPMSMRPFQAYLVLLPAHKCQVEMITIAALSTSKTDIGVL